jgi:multiple sugar transport system ATP-binding protein
MSALKLQNISKSYGDVSVLSQVSISIDSGEFLVLLGPSGCGKSTLLHAIAGLHSPTSGDILIGGARMNDVPCQHRDIAMVFQSYALYPSMTVEQNIAFPLEMRKVPASQRKQAVADAARLLRIEHLLKRKPSQLSGGQRQRVAIGRALVRNPQLFLFDEPLSNLDALLRVEMRTELKKLHQRIGRTTVYVTHDQVEAMTLATRIAILNKGMLQQIGTPAEVYNKPANLFVAGFIGSPAINLLKGVGEIAGGSRIFRTIAAGHRSMKLPIPMGLDVKDGQALTLGLRPEVICLGAGGLGPREVTVEVDVTLIEPTGPDSIIVFEFGGRECMARVAAGDMIKSGPNTISFSVHKSMFFDSETEKLIG